MNETSEIRDLLVQIRDLLIPIAAVHRPGYEEIEKQEVKRKQDILAAKVAGARSRQAAQLMDGTRSQSNIAKESGVTSGNLSKLVKDLRQLGLVNDSSRPCLTISMSEAKEAFAR